MDVLMDGKRNKCVMTESTSQALLTDEGLLRANSLKHAWACLRVSKVKFAIQFFLYSVFPYL